MERAAGIDLGTTFSTIAMIGETGRPEAIRNAEDETLTPSVVYIGDSEIIVGREAKALQAAGDPRVAAFFKRVMGDPNWVFAAGDKLYAPTDLSSFVLRKLKDDAEARLGAAVADAVITVPAYFSDLQRRNTIEAGKRAGLNVLRIINEPTAAAIAYGINRKFPQASVFLVYDLGGGTFDVTLVRIDEDNIEVLATEGNHELGGKDWDDVILRHVAARFEEDHGLNPLDDIVSMNDMLVRAELTKKALSTLSKTALNVSYGGKTARYEMTRDEFEQLTAHLMERTIILVSQVLEEAHFTWRSLSGVLLVGGSTRMPMVQRYVVEQHGKPPMAGVNVDEAVALGAAIQADIDVRSRPGLAAAAKETPRCFIGAARQIRDVMSHSLGTVAISEDRSRYVNSIIIQKNLHIPARETKQYQYRTGAHRANEMEVYVTQGESERPLDCTILGRYRILDIPHDESTGKAVIDITYAYDQNGVVQVSAVERASGAELRYAVEPVPDDMSWLDSAPDAVSAGDIDVLIAVDLSGSMSGAPLAEAQKAARDFVEKMDLTRTSVGLLAVADSVKVVQPLCQDARQLCGAIDSMKIGDVGMCNGGQPFTNAHDILKERGGTRVVILLADGVWSDQARAVEEAKRCHSEGIIVAAIGFGSADEGFLREVASSDENALFTDLSKLSSAFDRVAQVLTEGQPGIRGISPEKDQTRRGLRFFK